MLRKIITVILLISAAGFSHAWTDEEIEDILGHTITLYLYDSDNFESWDEFYLLARQTLLWRLMLSNVNKTYFMVETTLINPSTTIYSLDESENTIFGGDLSKVQIYIEYRDRGIYMYFWVLGTNAGSTTHWFNSYIHEIIFSKYVEKPEEAEYAGHDDNEEEVEYDDEHSSVYDEDDDNTNQWQYIYADLTDVQNKINEDFFTLIYPELVEYISDEKIIPWSIMNNFFIVR